ncbi:MAG: DNA gyrase subunit A [Planctomycetia bacterium]|nr:DNA gyrase subunit A [Planctomycetia bacterium]
MEISTNGKILDLSVANEMKTSYLTYAMSVIISRALPDVRDGLKPSQRRILVAMNDLNLGPTSGRIKCAKICGDTSGNYHPHGEAIIYPTLVRLAQEWNMRYILVDKQGNFGSIAGLPPAAMRYTEARMSRFASMMLEDLKLDTVDFIPTYDERNEEPTVLPSKFPNLLVNGANGIAVGMATSIPPHNLREICNALILLIDKPAATLPEILECVPGPDFPTGGIICGRSGIYRGYMTGRSTITVRARAHIEEMKKGNRSRIVVTEIPYQQARDRVEERIAELVTTGKIEGISAIRNESDLKEPVRLILELKRDADPNVVLNQLYQFSSLQDSFSLILLALVDGKPRILSFKEMLEEFLRHRVTVIRRRTQFLLMKARQRKHTVEGLMIAHANIDQVIRTIRTSKTQAEAKQRLLAEIRCPAALIERALGDDGFKNYCLENGVQENYTLTPVQVDAILRMTLGQLVNLEQEKLADEFLNLLTDIREYNRILSSDDNIRAIVREDLLEIRDKHGDARHTAIESIDLEATPESLIMEENMVVSITAGGYIKRTPTSTYRAQRRGGKGMKGAKTKESDPVEHLIVGSTHDYLMFFTNRGKVYWRKIYDIPEAARDALGRAIVNFLALEKNEKIADCRAVRNFDRPDHYLVMATANGTIKKTELSAFRRPLKAGLIALKLREDDELIGVDIVGPGDDLVLSTQKGRAIRFAHTDARPMGRAATGVRGIRLRPGDKVVGMAVAEPDAMLLTVCEHGYAKKTPFGTGAKPGAEGKNIPEESAFTDIKNEDEIPEDSVLPQEETSEDNESEGGDDEKENEDNVSSRSYRRQSRGGGGIIDIRTSLRNGNVIGCLCVHDEDDVLMMTARGKIQRISVDEIRITGRNTQGVRIMNMDQDDVLVAVRTVPKEDEDISDEDINDDISEDINENGNGNDDIKDSENEDLPENL